MSRRPPAYRRLRRPDGDPASDLAFVEIDGRRFYLGSFDSEKSHQAYNRTIREWAKTGGFVPERVKPGGQLDVIGLCAAFYRHAVEYYGAGAPELVHFRSAIKPLTTLYGEADVDEIGPIALKVVRDAMVEKGWSRKYVNSQVGRIKGVFRWAAENEMVEAKTWHALQAVSGLRRGRTTAREPDPIRPVPQERIDAIRSHVSRQVWALVQLQLLTGMRPGEAVLIRACDLTMSGKAWTYNPPQHKNLHRGLSREIYIGPKGQGILRPFLKPDLAAYLFSPAEAEAERRAALSAARTTPMSCGNRPGTNRSRRPLVLPGEWYSANSYRQAIHRGCDAAFPPPLDMQDVAEIKAWRKTHRWGPNRLRHNAATALRRDFGIDVAQSVLGHRMGSAVTEIYAEANMAGAMQAIAEVG